MTSFHLTPKAWVINWFRFCCIATRTPQPLHISLALLVVAAWLLRPGPAASLRGWRALYVAAVATHLGAQIWMTLISGVVLYFSLPRHEFGRVQTVLFPVYYAFNAVVSLLAVLAYFRTQTLTHFQHTSWIQLALLLAVFSIEVGRLVMGELAHCPRYIRVLKTFRAYHSTIAMGTMIALGCSCYSTMIIVDSMCL
ncbi:Transmembrane protein 205 [Papilio machaon]|uniref:Transmembrane protein 205 n=1 Tax=Papilio machaon TaxID=76193 RepID=A0A0N1PH31_PAPMA|nr:Transmembrane protein 205 [Papilio machaon]